MSIFDDVKAHVSVPMACELLDIEPPRGGYPGKILCPVHDDNEPSLKVDETLWYCHACGIGGDVIDFVAFVAGCSKFKAAGLLEDEGDMDVTISAPAPTPATDFREEFGAGRRYPFITEMVGQRSYAEINTWVGNKWPDGLVTPEDLDRWGCRLDKYNLFIPHYAAAGFITLPGIKVRKMVPPDIGAKSAITGSQFRKLYTAEYRWSSSQVIVCEGETDTWTMTKVVGDRPIDVVGLPSGTGSWQQVVDQLARWQIVYLALDSDPAGTSCSVVLGHALIKAGCQVIPMQSLNEFAGKDVTEKYANGWRLKDQV